MGVCQALSPEERVVKDYNNQIKQLILSELQELPLYKFTQPLRNEVNSIHHKYLVNLKILEDIEKLISLGKESSEVKGEVGFENFEEEVKNSCLILEDEITTRERDYDKQEYTESFVEKISKHQSLVMQIKVIYESEFDKKKYRKSLQYFLRWANIFNEHLEGGFLKPIYHYFCKSLYNRKEVELGAIFDETRVFVLMMIVIYTHIYKLKKLYGTSGGKLFKNENIFSLIMSFLFRKTKIKKFLKALITKAHKETIQQFEEKLAEVKDKNPLFFGVPKKFSLLKVNEEEYVPYGECVKLVWQLCDEKQTPITKLKIIVQISLEIKHSIEQYYEEEKEEAPDLDPDSLLSIVMYIISRANNRLVLEELKVVQNFTTNNCMNSISGYYLQTFNAAIQSILAI